MDADQSSEKTEYLGAFGFYVRIVGLLSKIHLFLRRPVNIGASSDVAQWQHDYRELNGKLRAWQASLPVKYQNVLHSEYAGGRQYVDAGIVLLHLTFHM